MRDSLLRGWIGYVVAREYKIELIFNIEYLKAALEYIPITRMSHNTTAFVKDRPVQTKAFNEVTKLLQTRHECLVKMFCGTGKSRVIQRIILNGSIR